MIIDHDIFRWRSRAEIRHHFRIIAWQILFGDAGLLVSKHAIDEAELIARDIWQRDRKHALDVVQQIGQSDRSFCPSEGPASPQSYRLVYRMLGFRGAQWLADSKRSVASIVLDRAI